MEAMDEGRIVLPGTLRPLLNRAESAYATWLTSCDDAFDGGEADEAAEIMQVALDGFIAGATDAGMDEAGVFAILQRKFPEAPGYRDPAVNRKPRAIGLTKPAMVPDTPLSRRYSDAYTVARTVIGLGGIVKVLAWVIGGTIAVAAILIAADQDPALLLSGVLLGVTVGIPLFVLGVLVSAVGQILRATLDTAVNTSPLLCIDDVTKIMAVQ